MSKDIQYQQSPTDGDLLPVVDREDRVIGSAPRRRVHLENLLHRAVHVVVVNSRGEILLQRRSKTKDSYPGWWDISMGGHVDVDEDYEAAARRELREELGVQAEPREIGRRAAGVESGWEFIRVYTCRHDGPFVFPPEEISEVRWIRREELTREAPRIAPSGRRSLMLWAGIKYADVVLVKTSPEEIVQGGWYRMPLLGLGYLAAYLRARGVSVAIVDAMFDRLSLEETAARVAEYSPRLAGFTAMTHEIGRAAETLRAIRERLPGVRAVAGGPHATALPARTLEEFPEFDYAVFGEGEETLWELYQAVAFTADDDNIESVIEKGPVEEKAAPAAGETDTTRLETRLEKINGLVWRRGGAIVQNGPRAWIEELDSLPMPAWDLYGASEVYQIYASRGCPFQCIFCMRALGERPRLRSPRLVVDEMETLVNLYHPREVDFSDETFTLRKEWTLAICAEIKRRGLDKKIRWFANGRVNTVDEEILRAMRAAGCFRVGYGIESGSQSILKAALKGTTLEQIRKAVRATKNAGLEIEAFYILGFPGETRATALETIRFAASLNTNTAAFGIMVPYPGTEVAAMAARGEGGYHLLSKDWRDFDKHLGNALELDTLTRRQLESLQARAYLWFYIRNLRLLDLARFVWEKRKAAYRLLGKLAGRQGKD